MSEAKPISRLINLREKPIIVFLDAVGNPVDAESPLAVAFDFPQYGLTFELATHETEDQDHAEKIAKECTTLGKTDWFIPDDRETQVLVCRDYYNPATYPELAKHTPTDDWYRTSKEDPSGSSCVCLVGFDLGGVGWSSRRGSARLRLCRLSAASQ